MGLFLPTFFKTRPRRTFEYKPRYYNEERERLDLLKRKYAAEGAEPVGSERAEREARMRQEFETQRPRRNTKGLLSRRGLLIAIGLVVVLLFFIL